MLEPCDLDDCNTFKSNGTLIYDAGPTKCDALEPQTINSIWSLNSDNTKITVGGFEYDITELTSTTMVLTNNGVLGGTTLSRLSYVAK